MPKRQNSDNMEIQLEKLILHKYNNEDIQKICVPNEIKSTDMEWNVESNKNHPFASDIQNADIVYSIENIGEPREQYGFFFFEKKTSSTGVIAYLLKKVVLDEGLQEDSIALFVNTLLKVMNNGNRLAPSNRLMLSIKKNYPLSEYQMSNTSTNVVNDILSQVDIEKSGIWNDDKNKEWLEKIVEKSKNCNFTD